MIIRHIWNSQSWLSCLTRGMKFLAFETFHAQMIHEMKQNGAKSNKISPSTEFPSNNNFIQKS